MHCQRIITKKSKKVKIASLREIYTRCDVATILCELQSKPVIFEIGVGDTPEVLDACSSSG